MSWFEWKEEDRGIAKWTKRIIGVLLFIVFYVVLIAAGCAFLYFMWNIMPGGRFLLGAGVGICLVPLMFIFGGPGRP